MKKDEPMIVERTVKRPPVDVLKKVKDDAVKNGCTFRSLRAIAETSGISHRMLIYHFGSQYGLFTAIINDIRDADISSFKAEISCINTMPELKAFFVRFWRSFESEDSRRYSLLFFETYLYALRHPDECGDFLESVVQPWVDTVASSFIKVGCEEKDSHNRARSLLAITRGFLLDLITTGDIKRIESAGLCLLDLLFADA
ncbi:TetR/AcrR family transcriptional regulator [Pseudomonas graminis]|uniref:TetR/AcrR family transcriptional regulator n=1 Tax=Pseudomonas graminis TaxID=158627 RepID=UPI0023494833|nr:TetR/AcrR family transcriptional regulator [Pseudomonas graminis]MDC6378919.1 TetR/AcrR family transcriptional regulator [Pseudomonas graminis]